MPTQCSSLMQCSQPGGNLPHQGHLAMFGDIFGCYNQKVPLASSGCRSQMLLNSLQCIGQAPHNKEWSLQNVSSADVEKSYCTT